MHPRRRALLARLRDDDAAVRSAASQALDRLDVLEALGRGLPGRLGALDPAGWVGLLRSLAGVRDEVSLRIALQALQRPEDDVRLAALERVEEFGDWRATAQVLRRLSDSHPVVRARAAEALGRLGDRRAAEPVARLLADGDARVVARAAEAVGLLGHAAAELRLLELAEHPDPDVRAAAAAALGRLPLSDRP
ncbi:MAG: HEAT repeat domain-containing protein [Deferrisomatales bacterium]